MDEDYESFSSIATKNSSYSFESLNESFKFETSFGKNGENIKIYNLPFKSGIMVLMDHPSAFTIYRFVSVKVLSGSVTVLGYEINPDNPPIKVFSSEKTGLIEIKTETYEQIWKRKSNYEDLQELFNSVTDRADLTTKILSNLGNSTVALFVQCIPYPANLQILEIYFPKALEFNLYEKKSLYRKLYVKNSKHDIPIRFNEDVEYVIGQISMLIRSAKLTEGEVPRVVVYGPRNSGKSSLIRYIINKILSMYIVAYYLDADPGQTEFTPPGVVSLTKVKKPIIGPSFCNQRDPISMIFTGSISPASPDMYSKSISKLMHLYNSKYKNEALFINTMGWMEGFGLKCLENVMTIVKPTVLIEITTEDESSMFDYREYFPKDKPFFQIRCNFERKNPFFNAKTMREMALLSYFGKCQSPFLGPAPLNEIRPYSVSWDKISIFSFHHKLQPYRLIEDISCSIVALCIVPESAILKSDIPQFPTTLEEEPDNECVGFGLVRAVDEMAHLLYIITPLSLDVLSKVNAIIKGDVMIPDTVFLNQGICDERLPYIYNSKRTPPDPQVKDKCKVSVCIAPESETNGDFSISNTPGTSVAAYRKRIPKRYKMSHK